MFLSFYSALSEKLMPPISSDKNTFQHLDTSRATIMADYHTLINLAVSAIKAGKSEAYIRRRLCDAYEFVYQNRTLLRQAHASPALAAE
jgi:hypothetical protein